MKSSLPLSIIVEAAGFVRIYEDGSIERLVEQSTVPPSPELESGDLHGVASKDVVINPETGVFVRLYIPRLDVTDANEKIPLLVYVHGGGFCIESAASPFYHNYLNKVATEAKVICVSVDYRRTPEHRLPAAYDDCFGVLEWLDVKQWHWRRCPWIHGLLPTQTSAKCSWQVTVLEPTSCTSWASAPVEGNGIASVYKEPFWFTLSLAEKKQLGANWGRGSRWRVLIRLWLRYGASFSQPA